MTEMWMIVQAAHVRMVGSALMGLMASYVCVHQVKMDHAVQGSKHA